MRKIAKPLPSSKSFHLDLLPTPRFTFDLIHISTAIPKSELERDLPSGEPHPLKELQAAKHKRANFKIEELTGTQWATIIKFVYPQSAEFMSLLTDLQWSFNPYRITRVELSLDFPAESVAHARLIRDFIVLHLRKLYPGRKFLKGVTGPSEEFEPGKRKRKRRPRGTLVGEATYYWEDEDGSTPLKIYVRYPKFGNGGPVCRVEWTIKEAKNIKSRLGILNIQDLPLFNSEDFFQRHFRLETIDYRKMGAWLFPHPTDAKKDRSWAAHLFLRHMYYEDAQAIADKALDAKNKKREEAGEEIITVDPSDEGGIAVDVLIKQSLIWRSVSQVRGFLVLQRDEAREIDPADRTDLEARFAELKRYRIDTFFPPLVPQ